MTSIVCSVQDLTVEPLLRRMVKHEVFRCQNCAAEIEVLAQDKKFWMTAISGLKEKMKNIKEEHSQLAHDAHETADSIPELSNMGISGSSVVAQTAYCSVLFSPGVQTMNTPPKMKLEPAYLDELTSQSKDYKVKVTVTEKGRAQPSPKKPGVIFQTIILQDEKKNRMRCALFGDQIEAYEDVLKPSGQYEISKAPISPVDDQYKFNLEELPYQMTVGQQTIIQRLNPESGPIEPKYQPLSTIPRSPDPNARFDIVGVILFVEEAPRLIPNTRGRDSPVREISITDTSQDHAMTISAWNDLTGKPCDAMMNWAEKFNVVGFTALKTRHTRGFTLNTTMSTRIILNPKGARADMLHRQERILNVSYPGTEKKVVTIAELRNKKAANATPDEIAWIRVTIPEADLQRVNAYIGCLGCGKRTHLSLGTRFPCISCKKSNATAVHKVTFKFEAIDASGTMSFTTFNDDTEKLFRKTAAEIWEMKTTGNFDAFKAVQEVLSTKPFFIQVTPTLELARNSVLLWTLKTIEMEDVEPSAQLLGSSSSSLNKEEIVSAVNQGQKIQKISMNEDAVSERAKMHGKQPSFCNSERNGTDSEDNTEMSDEVLAEIAQLHEFRLASQAFDTDCFDAPFQPPSKGITITEAQARTIELPTWSRLTRSRSNAKNKEPMPSDKMQESDDEEHGPRKKLRTALFKNNSEKESSDTEDAS
ncbi:uncharacterized protein LOC110721230 [Chenopodium quinoa]|uniref:uncharacterized protein LOC110721230 n=1 Tax=Chenopodium quinoa TaxID=63459 RepID=UPI000B790D93|nr:uncharacterized protein LOC110721230 [Chenopodium quinoa]